MPREYRHIKQYEKEMLEMKERGLTVREIGAKFGLTYEQAHDFFKQYNRKRRELSSGESFKSRGRASALSICKNLRKNRKHTISLKAVVFKHFSK